MVGISEKDFVINKVLGTSEHSYGYKADGKKYHNKSSVEDYGPKFEKKNVVGCGLIMATRQIFYTLDGRYIDVAFNNV